MAKPRVFVSSTYYDLKHIRRNLELFIEEMGYEPVLFESGDVPFEDKVPLDVSCYKEIQTCHILILIIGGRYGSAASNSKKTKQMSTGTINKHYEFYNSVTKEEYVKANNLSIPIFVFVEKGVLSEYETYKKNRKSKSIKYAHVDNPNVFRLIDDIFNEKVRFIKDFDNFDEIQSWLKEQWAGLFTNYLSKNIAQQELKTLSSQVSELSVIVNTLKGYSEAIMRQIKPPHYEKIIKEADEKLQLADKYSELLEIGYIRHLNHTHKFKIDVIHDMLIKVKNFEEFKKELFKIDGNNFKCIDNIRARREINSARELLGKDIFPISEDEVDKYNKIADEMRKRLMQAKRNAVLSQEKKHRGK